MSKKREVPEVTSFNEELVSFDIDAVSVEELERRFELAVADIFEPGVCGTLTCSAVGCADMTCGTFLIRPNQQFDPNREL